MTHICVSKLTTIGSDNGLSPGRRQAITLTNGGMLLIRPLGTNFSEIWSEIHTFSFKKMHLKTSSAKWRPFCLGLNVLIKEGLRPNVQKTNKVDGLFVILFGPLILKIVSPLDPHWLIARRNPANGYEMQHKAWSSIEEVPYHFWRSSIKFHGHTAQKSVDVDPN